MRSHGFPMVPPTLTLYNAPAPMRSHGSSPRMAKPKPPPRAPESFAQRLAATVRLQRRSLGLSQLMLARLAGCGVDFIYDLEAGKPTIRLDKLVEVLRVMGLELRVSTGKSGLS